MDSTDRFSPASSISVSESNFVRQVDQERAKFFKNLYLLYKSKSTPHRQLAIQTAPDAESSFPGRYAFAIVFLRGLLIIPKSGDEA